jgi:hypothetical protein
MSSVNNDDLVGDGRISATLPNVYNRFSSWQMQIDLLDQVGNTLSTRRTVSAVS